jgi:DNA-binding NarL/FixJ family response regulator
MENLAILIIESNTTDSRLIKDYLCRAPLKAGIIDTAESLHAALERLARTAYDVILVNLMLSDSSGLETIRSIVNGAPEAAIIAISEGESHALASKSIRFGAQDHLEKQHISPIMLLKSLCYAIERRTMLQEKEDVLNDLGTALEKIGSLENILPFCVNCRKIRNAAGQWLNLEEYINEHDHRGTNRLICPNCRQDF